MSSKMFAYDVATTNSIELHAFRNIKPGVVLCMLMDIHGYVWLGLQAGVVEVWDAQQQVCLCHESVMASDIRYGAGAFKVKSCSSLSEVQSCTCKPALLHFADIQQISQCNLAHMLLRLYQSVPQAEQ